MSRLNHVDPATAQGEAKKLFDQVQRQLGGVPNFMQILGNSPPALAAFLGLNGNLSRGSLDPKTRLRVLRLGPRRPRRASGAEFERDRRRPPRRLRGPQGSSRPRVRPDRPRATRRRLDGGAARGPRGRVRRRPDRRDPLARRPQRPDQLPRQGRADRHRLPPRRPPDQDRRLTRGVGGAPLGAPSAPRRTACPANTHA